MSYNKDILIDFLKELLLMIEQGATGNDLAREIEKKKMTRELIYDGIVFYDTFLEIGDNIVNDTPDEEKKDYGHFKIVEDSHKQVFLKWATELIENYKKQKLKEEIYKRYKKSRDKWYTEDLYCEKCGIRIKDKHQKVCEECGTPVKK